MLDPSAQHPCYGCKAYNIAVSPISNAPNNPVVPTWILDAGPELADVAAAVVFVPELEDDDESVEVDSADVDVAFAIDVVFKTAVGPAVPVPNPVLLAVALAKIPVRCVVKY